MEFVNLSHGAGRRVGENAIYIYYYVEEQNVTNFYMSKSPASIKLVYNALMPIVDQHEHEKIFALLSMPGITTVSFYFSCTKSSTLFINGISVNIRGILNLNFGESLKDISLAPYVIAVVLAIYVIWKYSVTSNTSETSDTFNMDQTIYQMPFRKKKTLFLNHTGIIYSTKFSNINNESSFLISKWESNVSEKIEALDITTYKVSSKEEVTSEIAEIVNKCFGNGKIVHTQHMKQLLL